MIRWVPEDLLAVPCTHSLSPVLKTALLRSCCCPCWWSHWSHGAGISRLLGSSLNLHQWPLLGSLQVLWPCLTFSPWPLQSWGFFHCCWGCNFTSSLSWSQAKAALRDPFSPTTRGSSSLQQSQPALNYSSCVLTLKTLPWFGFLVKVLFSQILFLVKYFKIFSRFYVFYMRGTLWVSDRTSSSQFSFPTT